VSPPALKEGVLLPGTYDPEIGFGFEASSLELLTVLLNPNEVLEVDGGARLVDDVEWSAVPSAAASPGRDRQRRQHPPDGRDRGRYLELFHLQRRG